MTALLSDLNLPGTMQETIDRGVNSTDNVTVAVCFGGLSVNFPGDDPARSCRVIYEMLRAGFKPDSIVTNNHTTEGVRSVRRFATAAETEAMNSID